MQYQEVGHKKVIITTLVKYYEVEVVIPRVNSNSLQVK